MILQSTIMINISFNSLDVKILVIDCTFERNEHNN